MSISPTRLFLHIIFAAALLLISQPGLAQDNPNVDNLVGIQRPMVPAPLPPIFEVTTSPEGYDNFFLGEDFAETHISMNPLDPLQTFSGANGFAAGGINSYHSENGYTWSASSPPFPGGFGDPVTAYDTLGNLYFITMKNPLTGCWVVKSTDNGNSWTSAVTAINGGDRPWLAADQTNGPFSGNVYCTMTSSSFSAANFTRSTDGGVTWPQTNTFTPHGLPGAMVAIGPDVLTGDIPGGAVYVVTNYGSSFDAFYGFYRSTDGGATFDFMSSHNWANYVGDFVNGRNSVENFRTRPYPFIAADNSYGPYRGRLYCVYASNDPPGNGFKPDIWFRYSDDQGATWTDEIIINDDPSPQDNHQWHPAIWTDLETGRIYLKWLDSRRSFPDDDSCDVYASYSDDGGVTWAENQRLTNEKFVINCTSCNGGTPAYLGDYDAITSNGITSMACWSDFGEGDFRSTTAYFPDYAMLLSSNSDTVLTTGSKDIFIHVPDVKLYDETVEFSVSVDPDTGFVFDFSAGTMLTSYPDSLPLNITWTDVPEGVYTVTVVGEGPNGTPVHTRTVELLATTTPFVALQNPNGGEEIFEQTVFPISWLDGGVDEVTIDYSTDNGTSWILVADSVGSRPAPLPPKANVKPGFDPPTELFGTYYWVVPTTVSDMCLVRISDVNDGGISDTSDAAFSIVAAPAPQWRAQASPNADDLYTVALLDSAIAWAGGAGGTVLKTLDGGNTWTTTVGSVGNDVYNLEIIGPSTVLVATYEAGAGAARIMRTQNGGLTWSEVYFDDSPGAFINAIHMFDANNGFAQGDPVSGNWTLLSTTDAGNTWTDAATLVQDGSEAGWNNSMVWNDTLHGWFGTGNSRIYYTDDGGSTWSFGTTSFANSFGVDFDDDNTTGVAGGSAVASSLDGGATWMDTPGQPGSVSAVSIANLDQLVPRDPVWFATSGTSIYRSEDQGASFTVDHTEVSTYNHIDMNVEQLDGLDWAYGFAVGNAGTITKYTELLLTTDITQADDMVPETYSLRQNYPNPFNPSTTISYDIPEQSDVTLRIYDVLGQSVRTLVDAQQGAGSYKAVWDGLNAFGTNVSSGIYFYRLEATTPEGGTFVDMKKMILMK